MSARPITTRAEVERIRDRHEVDRQGADCRACGDEYACECRRLADEILDAMDRLTTLKGLAKVGVGPAGAIYD